MISSCLPRRVGQGIPPITTCSKAQIRASTTTDDLEQTEWEVRVRSTPCSRGIVSMRRTAAGSFSAAAGPGSKGPSPHLRSLGPGWTEDVRFMSNTANSSCFCSRRSPRLRYRSPAMETTRALFDCGTSRAGVFVRVSPFWEIGTPHATAKTQSAIASLMQSVAESPCS